MLDNLNDWSLDDLIERVIKERLIDGCVRKDDHVVIVQGSTRFVLDPGRAHAFLRGVVKGMSPERRVRSRIEHAGGTSDKDVDAILDRGESSGLFDSFRRHLIKKWWGRYAEAGCPFGRSVRGLMFWIRYDTKTTAS